MVGRPEKPNEIPPRSALALVSWYLISPPAIPLDQRPTPYYPVTYDYGAPLFKRNRSGTDFSDRPKCEDYKCFQFRAWRTNEMPDPQRGIEIEALDRSFCIEENDPRLKSNSGNLGFESGPSRQK